MISVRSVVIAFLALAPISALAQDSPIVTAAKRGKLGMRLPVVGQAPEIGATRWWNSKPIELNALRGNVVLLDFWATWCASCVFGMPKVQALAQTMPVKVVLLHSPHTPYGHTGMSVDEFIREKHLTLPIGLLAENCLEAYGEHGYPMYVLIDKEGRSRWQNNSLPNEASIRSVLAEP